MTKVIEIRGGMPFQSVDVRLGDNAVTLRLSYVASITAWAMDVYQEGAPLFAGAMLRSNADILQSWGVRETFGAMSLIGDEPDFNNLGRANLLIWTPPDEL